MTYGSFITVDDGGAAGHETAEILAEEREMRATEYYGINGFKIILFEIPVQGAFNQFAVVKLPVFHDFH